MSVDWSRLLSPASRLRLRRTAAEIERLHGLPDRWLAEELLRLARRTRREFQEKLGNPHGYTYEATFCWHLVPEVARRLGAWKLLPNEATAANIVACDDAELRVCAGTFLGNMSLGSWSLPKASERDQPLPPEILCHDIANGNPVAFAMDRIHPAPPAGADREDWIARHVREISFLRGFDSTPYWTPGLQAGRSESAECDPAPDEDREEATSVPGGAAFP